MKKFEIIREIFGIVMRVGFNDDKQDSISEYTKDKLTNKVYVKKINIAGLDNIDSIAVTAIESDFSDACDSDVRIAFNTTLGKRIILYANEVDLGVLKGIYDFLRKLFGSDIDEDCYQRVMKQIEYMKKIDAPLNLPSDALHHILKRYKEEILDNKR